MIHLFDQCYCEVECSRKLVNIRPPHLKQSLYGSIYLERASACPKVAIEAKDTSRSQKLWLEIDPVPICSYDSKIHEGANYSSRILDCCFIVDDAPMLSVQHWSSSDRVFLCPLRFVVRVRDITFVAQPLHLGSTVLIFSNVLKHI